MIHHINTYLAGFLISRLFFSTDHNNSTLQSKQTPSIFKRKIFQPIDMSIAPFEILKDFVSCFGNV